MWSTAVELSHAEAEAAFELHDVTHPYQDEEYVDQPMRVFRGGLVVDGDFDLYDEVGNVPHVPFNTIVAGEFVVGGDLDWFDNGAGHFLLVTGNLVARNVFVNGWSGYLDMVVLGDVRVDNAVHMTSGGCSGGAF